MKKLLNTILILTAFVAVSLPLHANAPHEIKRATLIDWLDTSEAILQDMQSSSKTAIPVEVLRRAQAIVVINQVHAGIFLGIKDGYAVALVRRPNGKWSIPVFLRAAETSLGFQLGVKSENTVLVIMDEATTRLLLKNRFNFGAEAKAQAGVRGRESEAVNRQLTEGANILAYSLRDGYYFGATVKTGFMQPDEVANRTFYKTNHRTPELLFSDWVTPPEETNFLINYVTRLTNR